MGSLSKRWLLASALTMGSMPFLGQARAGDDTVLLKGTKAGDAETLVVKGGGGGGRGGGGGGRSGGGGGGRSAGGSFRGSGFSSGSSFRGSSWNGSRGGSWNGANRSAWNGSRGNSWNNAWRGNSWNNAWRGNSWNSAWRGNSWNNAWRGNNWNTGWRGNSWNGWRGNNWNSWNGWRGNNWWGWRGNPWWGWRGNNWWGWRGNPWWGWSPWVSAGWGLGWSSGWGNNTFVDNTWAPGVYYASPDVIYYTSGYAPSDFSADQPPPPNFDGFGGGADLNSQRPPYETAPPPRPYQEDRTYPYNGGPNRQVPMPPADPNSISVPRPATIPLDGRPVSLPAKSTKYTYTAYGEDRQAKPAPPEKGYLVKEKASK